MFGCIICVLCDQWDAFVNPGRNTGWFNDRGSRYCGLFDLLHDRKKSREGNKVKKLQKWLILFVGILLITGCRDNASSNKKVNNGKSVNDVLEKQTKAEEQKEQIIH